MRQKKGSGFVVCGTAVRRSPSRRRGPASISEPRYDGGARELFLIAFRAQRIADFNRPTRGRHTKSLGKNEIVRAACTYIETQSKELVAMGGCVPGLFHTLHDTVDFLSLRFFIVGWGPGEVDLMKVQHVRGHAIYYPEALSEFVGDSELVLSEDGRYLLPVPYPDESAIRKQFRPSSSGENENKPA